MRPVNVDAQSIRSVDGHPFELRDMSDKIRLDEFYPARKQGKKVKSNNVINNISLDLGLLRFGYIVL